MAAGDTTSSYSHYLRYKLSPSITASVCSLCMLVLELSLGTPAVGERRLCGVEVIIRCSGFLFVGYPASCCLLLSIMDIKAATVLLQ